MKRPVFDYCATCGGDLDTGWECNGCGQDWISYAVPWWDRLWARFKRGLERY